MFRIETSVYLSLKRMKNSSQSVLNSLGECLFCLILDLLLNLLTGELLLGKPFPALHSEVVSIFVAEVPCLYAVE